MELSSNLISQFVKVTNDRDSEKKEISVYGTIVNDGTQDYVRLDGSEELAPIETTVEINNGERVVVTIQNHNATVTGNIDNPSIGVKTADGIRSSITQTAKEILLEVARVEGEFGASLKLQEDSITSIVKAQDEFSEFKQTVEGFSFMGKGGTVKISGGNIDLTGAITFSSLDKDTQDKIDGASSTANSASQTASSAYTQAGNALLAANNAADVAGIAYDLASNVQLPSYLQSTYIDSTLVMSPTIVGGSFYASGYQTWTSMTSSGLEVWRSGLLYPRIHLQENGSNLIQMILGAGGTGSATGNNRLYVWKDATTAGIKYVTDSGATCGFTFNSNGTITRLGSWAN